MVQDFESSHVSVCDKVTLSPLHTLLLKRNLLVNFLIRAAANTSGSDGSDYGLITWVCTVCAGLSELSSLCLFLPLFVAMPQHSGCKSRRCRFRE